MRVRATLAAFSLIGLIATAAEAQQPAAQNPVEIGVDAQIAFGLDDQGTAISIPAQKIRAGFLIAEAMTVEPALGFVRLSNNGSSMSNTTLDLSLLYHFDPSRAARQLYVRPVIGIHRMAGESSSITFMNVGVAGGIKVPLMDRFGTRIEAEFRNRLEKDGIPSQSALNLNFGLSYFTR